MKVQRLVMVLTIFNLGLLMFALVQIQRAGAQDITPVLRGRALEIIDGQGRIRASITVLAAVTMPTGKRYPETVILRLIDPKGRPAVKLTASDQGSGLGLAGDSDPTYALLKAERTGTSLKLTNKDGRELLIKP